MRTVRLARIAAEAEGLRLRHSIRRAAIRCVLGLVAGIFLFGVLIFCHLAAWYWLRESWQGRGSALIIAGADFVLAMFLVLLAARSSPGRVEVEALAVRQRALENATRSLAFSSIAMQLLQVGANFVRRRR